MADKYALEIEILRLDEEGCEHEVDTYRLPWTVGTEKEAHAIADRIKLTTDGVQVIPTGVIFDRSRAKENNPDEDIRVVCARVKIDEYQYEESYMVFGMEGVHEFNVAEHLLEYYRVPINGSEERERPNQFFAMAIDMAELGGVWHIQQTWEREVV